MGDLILAPTIDYDEVAKRVWERLIPAVPVSGAFEEKFKQKIIAYELVAHQAGAITLAAGASTTVDITPATGEVWQLHVGGVVGDAASSVFELRDYDGVTTRIVTRERATNPKVFHYSMIITDSLWCNIYGYNGDTTSRILHYGYSALKLKSSSISIPKLKPSSYLLNELSRMNVSNPHSSVALPDYLKALEGYAFLDEHDKVSILLEEDIVLRRDERGNTVERADKIWCTLEDFERLFGDLIADETKRPLMGYIRTRSVEYGMGWEKYIDKWRTEGIVF